MKASNFLLYTTPSGDVRLDVMLFEESFWLTQKQIADLFSVTKSTISEHFSNIFESGELDKTVTYAKFAQVQKEGERSVNRNLEFYNLDAIISVGYRVNSTRATQFRIWATANRVYYNKEVDGKIDFEYKNDRLKKYVYIISHPKFKGYYKVGFTKDYKNRLNSYQTSDPDRAYKMEYFYLTPHFRETEKYIHNLFDNKFEWIKAPLEDIKKEIENYKDKE